MINLRVVSCDSVVWSVHTQSHWWQNWLYDRQCVRGLTRPEQLTARTYMLYPVLINLLEVNSICIFMDSVFWISNIMPRVVSIICSPQRKNWALERTMRFVTAEATKLSLCNTVRLLDITIQISFYRAMHFSAKRGIAIACRLSVCLSVCDVSGLWSHRLEFFENNITIS